MLEARLSALRRLREWRYAQKPVSVWRVHAASAPTDAFSRKRTEYIALTRHPRSPLVMLAAGSAIRCMAAAGALADNMYTTEADLYSRLAAALHAAVDEPAIAISVCDALVALMAGQPGFNGEGCTLQAAIYGGLRPSEILHSLFAVAERQRAAPAAVAAALAAATCALRAPVSFLDAADVARAKALAIEAIREHEDDAAVAVSCCGVLKVAAILATSTMIGGDHGP